MRARSLLHTLLLAALIAGGATASAQPGPGTGIAIPPRVTPMGSRGPAHFADRTANLPSEPVTAIAVDPYDDAVIYVGFDGFVFMSDDGGDAWRPILSFARGLSDDGALNDTAVGAFDGVTNGQGLEDSLADGAGGDLGGGGLLDDELPQGDFDDDDDDDLREAAFGPGGIDAADDPVDVIDTSTPARVDAGVRAFAFVPGSRGVMLVATSRGIFRTTTGGTSFERIRLPGGARENDVRDVVVDPGRPSRLWIGTAAGLVSSPDGGATIVRAPGRAGTMPVVDLAMDDAGAGRPAHLLVGTERGLLRSRDGGDTLSDLLLQGVGAFPTIHSVAWNRDTDTVFAGVAEGLFAAQRGAAILDRFPGLPNLPPSGISADPLWPGGLAVAVRGSSGGGVVFSDDAGLTLVDVDILPAQGPTGLAREKRDPTRLWVATDRGVYRLQPGTGIRVGGDALAAMRERFSREPDLQRFTDRVLLVHGMWRDDGAMRDRASVATWLPRMGVRYVVFAGDANQVRNTFIFRDPSTLPPIIEDDDNNDLFGDGFLVVSPSQPVRHEVWMQLVWDLDRLILNPDVLRSARQLPLLRNAERRLVDRTRELYVARRRLVAELMAPATTLSPRDRVLRELRLQELEAQLAGLADGDLFSSASNVSSTSSSSFRPVREAK